MYTDQDTKQDILDELRKFTQSDTEAQEFFDWIEEEGFTNYDCLERWMKGMVVINTKDLYSLFINQ